MSADHQKLGMYVWRGANVLKAYGSGVVAVLAVTEEDAWKRLGEADAQAYFSLLSGGKINWVESEEEYQYAVDDTEPVLVKINPVRYELHEAPVIVQWGSS